MFLLTKEGGAFPVAGLSVNAVARLEGVAGAIGRDSLQKMFKAYAQGEVLTIKGFFLADKQPSKGKGVLINPARAKSDNPAELIRARNAMKIKVFITNRGRMELEYNIRKGDFARFLAAVEKAGAGGIEYSEIAESLNWDRNIVSIYTARAKGFRLVSTTKKPHRVR